MYINNKIMKLLKLILIISLFYSINCVAQSVPAAEENIPFLVTFGSKAKTSYGDDNFKQTYYFTLPSDFKKPFYIRVFDPDINNDNDEIIGDANTKTKFTVYGGKGCISKRGDTDNKLGNLLASKTFDNKIT